MARSIADDHDIQPGIPVDCHKASLFVIRRICTLGHNMKIGLALILLCTAFVACVPISVDYYKPEAPGGKAISKACGAINAPKDTWRYEMDQVTLEAIVGEDDLDEPPGEFILRLFVPVGTEVSLQSKEISMRTLTNPKHQNLELMKLHLFRGTFKKELEKLESTVFKGSAKDEFGLFKGRRIFLFSAEIKTPIEHEIFITLPLITVDGKVFKVPEIRFVKEKKFGIYPINC